MSKEKTILEWLEVLPDGYRERALRNFDPNFHNGSPINDTSDAIVEAFSWENTPEGLDFWNDVCTWADGYGELPPLPEEENG